MAPIDPSRFRLKPVPQLASPKRPARPRRGEGFLKGPVPLGWLEAAARLPGKSLHAGVALWYAAGLSRSAVIPLSNLAGLRFGMDRNAKYRALEWLEEAGLIKIERKLGRAPVVTILPLEPLP